MSAVRLGGLVALAVLIAAPVLSVSGVPQQPAPHACFRCGWTAPSTRRVVRVKNVEQLHRAAREAGGNTTILLADGDYRLTEPLDVIAEDTVLRGESGDPSRVVLRGAGMSDRAAGVAISVSAAGVTVADLSVRDVGYHAVQVRGERAASGFTLHNAMLADTGQQLLKVSVGNGPPYADRGTVACSRFQYTNHAPSNYTDGVDIISGGAWTIRDNEFLRIRGPENGGWSGGPAVLVWGGSEDTLVERNVIIDSFRGIALGLIPRGDGSGRHGVDQVDHLRGTIRNNVIVNMNRWADEPIEANAARDVRIEHNTVLSEGAVPWSISVRFPVTTALVRNNLTSRQTILRDGGRAEMAGNVTNAKPGWFLDPAGPLLRLGPGGTAAVDAGVPIPDVLQDFDRRPRSVGRAPDAGAFESGAGPQR